MTRLSRAEPDTARPDGRPYAGRYRASERWTRRCEGQPVPARKLGLVQGRVRTRHALRKRPVGWQDGKTGACSQPHARSIAADQRRLSQSDADPIAHRTRLARQRATDQSCEFLTSNPRYDVAAAHALAQYGGEAPESLIPPLVSVHVVHEFEVVEVEDCHAPEHLGARVLVHGVVGRLEGAPIAYAGQRISARGRRQRDLLPLAFRDIP
jgi:hypothetical protein